MTRPRRFLAVALATVATLALPGAAVAAPASTSFAVASASVVGTVSFDY